VRQQKGILPSSQCLYSGSSKLEDDQSLEECGVESGSVLLLLSVYQASDSVEQLLNAYLHKTADTLEACITTLAGDMMLENCSFQADATIQDLEETIRKGLICDGKSMAVFCANGRELQRTDSLGVHTSLSISIIAELHVLLKKANGIRCDAQAFLQKLTGQKFPGGMQLHGLDSFVDDFMPELSTLFDIGTFLKVAKKLVFYINDVNLSFCGELHVHLDEYAKSLSQDIDDLAKPYVWQLCGRAGAAYCAEIPQELRDALLECRNELPGNLAESMVHLLEFGFLDDYDISEVDGKYVVRDGKDAPEEEKDRDVDQPLTDILRAFDGAVQYANFRFSDSFPSDILMAHYVSLLKLLVSWKFDKSSVGNWSPVEY